MKIRIISVGKPSSSEYQSLIGEFEKRLSGKLDIQWVYIPTSGKDEQTSRRIESDAVRTKLSDAEYVILLDERGTELPSEGLAAKLEQWIGTSRPLVIVIGGAYGVDEDLRSRADFIWSLSPLVFPHQLVRLILAEQLYRASMINAGHPYHHV